ncbi:unnamed protein product [Microthlaspi erraticum]|uniref:Uncharacterized protein n=1 Tax=Microthlaspi erraticum TaxID=1685480 RepID=A0A6D2JUM2_9BRAS|nr:unnamed protein product [Microthlaspi erraticum]
MDFIKTSSLRALIELTFQRNWNGLIWMSRKGVTTKRVETVQTALSKNQRPTAQSGWPRNYVSALGQIISVRLKSRPKFQTDRPITQHDPGNIVPRSAKLQSSTPRRARPCRASRGTRPRGRATVPRTTPMHPSEPGKNVPRPAENHRPNHLRPTTAGRHPHPRPADRSDSPRPDCPADRPARPSQRRGRPEALFEAQFHIFKPGLTLSRL